MVDYLMNLRAKTPPKASGAVGAWFDSRWAHKKPFDFIRVAFFDLHLNSLIPLFMVDYLMNLRAKTPPKAFGAVGAWFDSRWAH